MEFKLTLRKIIITLCLSLILLSVQILTSYSPNSTYTCCDYGSPRNGMGFRICFEECSYLQKYFVTNLIFFGVSILL